MVKNDRKSSGNGRVMIGNSWELPEIGLEMVGNFPEIIGKQLKMVEKT